MSVEVPVSSKTRSAISPTRVPVTPSVEPHVMPQSAALASSETRSPFSEALPFTGFAGRVFMWACLTTEVLDDWVHAKSPTRGRVESATLKKFGTRAGGWLFSLLAAVCCSLAAACLLPLFWSSPFRRLAPFVFLLVIVYFAARFGNMAGVLGTIGAALVFEFFLFEPRFSLAISSSAERNRLICMVIAGLCVSETLGRRKPPAVYKP